MVNQTLKKILESHTVATLRKEITKAKKSMFGATSKMKKAQLITHMLKTPSHFKHLKMNPKKKKAPVKRKKATPAPTIKVNRFMGEGLSGGAMNRRRLMMALRRSM